ncbi:hypothetical protein A3A39_00530 [Candidatus Kaiserbacteria bacterium RIFCSPLOWO2_01_FULL_54_13]|uniref:Prepilin peptidase n=1 Tax=Candidatus Kaiserbacteria bacterium RIFCSPLOWO2_01_FULL_54_13 TaxID=1798512 RepID=A0A1F6F0Q4_9BACT|nr:MAG: hypothetical protein A3A39_00530 [Candidatus Kaiserbacteria bacterium RIFCSPLOWO2_01_FULL_54_13]
MLVPIAFGLFGLIVGSFLNVLILRWGKRALTGRSTCESCERTIPWYDLVPVLSWVALRGRCRFCGAWISIQYILVETVVALVFALIGIAPVSLYLRVLALPVAALLIAIAVYDLRHTLIPDLWVYVAGGLALVISLVSAAAGGFGESVLLVLSAGPATALPLFAMWFVSRGVWMGLGDVKLALTMGWLLGLEGGLAALFLAFILGAIVSAPLLFFSSSLWKRISARYHFLHTVFNVKAGKGYTMKSEIPFGQFLILATFIIWFTNMYGITPLTTFF